MTVTPDVLRIPELSAEPGLVHGFSTLVVGSVGLTHASDADAVRESRRRFARVLDLDPALVTVVGAVHGAEVARVDEPQDAVTGVDALVTDRPGVPLFATYADCYPILLWDPVRRAVGLAHAGWRGTEARVAAAAVRAMHAEFGSEAADIRAGLGPGICGRCYEVGEEVAQRFDSRFTTRSPAGRFLLDLAAANAYQLHGAGVGHVFALDICTKESELLPSHRRDPDGTRFGAIVAIR